VLFVRDKYTINTLLESKAGSVLALLFFIWDEEHDEIKSKNANSMWVIEVVIFIARYSLS
jgi:hypothetical protein